MKLNPENMWVLLEQEIGSQRWRAKAKKEEALCVYKTSNI